MHFLIISFMCLLPVSDAVAQSSPEWIEKWPDTDFLKLEVTLSEINYAGMPKDGIPALNRPRFNSVKKAGAWIQGKEPVLLIEKDGFARAYPLQILLYHQIINDTFRGDPIVVTFCPLCNNGVVLSRKVAGKVLTFGTSGLLRNSGMIMFDRQTESLWQQFTGIGIVGNYASEQLQSKYASQIISFSQFAQRYPKGKVLSRDTGFSRQYGMNPFQGYDSIDNVPFLFEDDTDPRLSAMERVLNIRINESHTLYPFSTIDMAGIINDVVGDSSVVVLSAQGYASPLDKTSISASTMVPLASAYNRNINGIVHTFFIDNEKIVDMETRSTWNIFGEAISGKHKGVRLNRVDSGVNFAFAAFAFSPQATVYKVP